MGVSTVGSPAGLPGCWQPAAGDARHGKAGRRPHGRAARGRRGNGGGARGLAAAAAPQKLLKLDPFSGLLAPVRDHGVDPPAGRQVEFVWMTADGSYEMKAGPENVEFWREEIVEKRWRSAGRPRTPAAG
jgi:hypothetical protein